MPRSVGLLAKSSLATLVSNQLRRDRCLASRGVSAWLTPFFNEVIDCRYASVIPPGRFRPNRRSPGPFYSGDDTSTALYASIYQRLSPGKSCRYGKMHRPNLSWRADAPANRVPTARYTGRICPGGQMPGKSWPYGKIHRPNLSRWADARQIMSSSSTVFGHTRDSRQGNPQRTVEQP